MHLVPYKEFNLESHKSIAELQNIIDRFIYPFHAKGKPPLSIPVLGTRHGNHFKLLRAAQFHIFFSPIAHGELIEKEGETHIRVVMKLKKWPSSFMLLYMVFFLIFALLMVLNTAQAPALASVVSSLFGYLFVQYVFWSEVPRLKSIIEQVMS